ncbi:homeobox protein Hox-A2-like [Microplitis mediator]|uniref:homeobox protein Hox-A2-like n=1 Tax=Microplitis mediator TaxID=375433 RepID=UPI0025549781|nr:homeobox protein Hox-A2-like [Microplitis mediator]
MSVLPDFDVLLNYSTLPLEFPTYGSSPEGIRSEESSTSPPSSSDEVKTSKTTKGGINIHRKPRTRFSQNQLDGLERLFADIKFLCRPRRIFTAKQLGLEERQVKVWFQNRRMKDKKEKDRDAKLRRINTSAGYGATVHHQHHHHLPQNVELNTGIYNSYCPNAVSCQTSYSGSQQNGHNYTESYNNASNSNSIGYPDNNNNNCNSSISGINNNHNSSGYYSQPDDKSSNCIEDFYYYTTTGTTASEPMTDLDDFDELLSKHVL